MAQSNIHYCDLDILGWGYRVYRDKAISKNVRLLGCYVKHVIFEIIVVVAPTKTIGKGKKAQHCL